MKKYVKLVVDWRWFLKLYIMWTINEAIHVPLDTFHKRNENKPERPVAGNKDQHSIFQPDAKIEELLSIMYLIEVVILFQFIISLIYSLM